MSVPRTEADPRESGAEPLPEELVVLVIRTAKALVDRFRAERPDTANSPLTVVHGLAARYLIGRDDVTTVDLARYLGITKQSTSEVVALLERTGTVRRAPHPSDRRARVLLLTDDGASKLEAGRMRWQHIEDEWADLVGRDRLEVVREALQTFLDAEPAGTATTFSPISAPTGSGPVGSGDGGGGVGERA